MTMQLKTVIDDLGFRAQWPEAERYPAEVARRLPTSR